MTTPIKENESLADSVVKQPPTGPKLITPTEHNEEQTDQLLGNNTTENVEVLA